MQTKKYETTTGLRRLLYGNLLDTSCKLLECKSCTVILVYITFTGGSTPAVGSIFANQQTVLKIHSTASTRAL
jgi:hypothetical protein